MSNEEIPCKTCLVLPICMADSRECKTYTISMLSDKCDLFRLYIQKSGEAGHGHDRSVEVIKFFGLEDHYKHYLEHFGGNI